MAPLGSQRAGRASFPCSGEAWRRLCLPARHAREQQKGRAGACRARTRLVAAALVVAAPLLVLLLLLLQRQQQAQHGRGDLCVWGGGHGCGLVRWGNHSANWRGATLLNKLWSCAHNSPNNLAAACGMPRPMAGTSCASGSTTAVLSNQCSS